MFFSERALRAAFCLSGSFVFGACASALTARLERRVVVCSDSGAARPCPGWKSGLRARSFWNSCARWRRRAQQRGDDHTEDIFHEAPPAVRFERNDRR
jgi:hypothetical protein